jgi:predicted metal-dependent hydrolase
MSSALDSARNAALAAFTRSFDAGAFFEAHEILEAFWVTYQGDDRDFYRGLIQASVALHHLGTGNTVGAGSVGARARKNLEPYAPRYASVDVASILARLAAA